MILPASTKTGLPLNSNRLTLSLGLGIVFFANNKHAAVAKLETLCSKSRCRLLPENLNVTSSLSSHETIKAGEPVTLTCDADLMDLDEKHTYVARIILLSDCAEGRGNILIDYNPDGIVSINVFNKNAGRDWEMTCTEVKLNTSNHFETLGRGCQLTLNDADCRDACTYECVVDARITGSYTYSFLVSRQQRLQVPVANPKITVDPVKEKYTEGERIKLTCIVKGSDVNITWKQSVMADGVFIDYPNEKDISMDVSIDTLCIELMNYKSTLVVTAMEGSRGSQYKCLAAQGTNYYLATVDLEIEDSLSLFSSTSSSSKSTSSSSKSTSSSSKSTLKQEDDLEQKADSGSYWYIVLYILLVAVGVAVGVAVCPLHPQRRSAERRSATE